MDTNFLPASALIFDLDGTLLDTEPLYTLATQRVFDEYGKVFTLDFKRTIVGREARESAEMTVQHFDLPIDAETFLAARGYILQTLFPDAPAIEGAERFMATLHPSGFIHGIATSSARELFELKRSKKTWLKAVTRTLCGDEVAKSKPDPDIFLTMARTLGIDPSDCVVFEDAESGIQAAEAAGMRVICVDSPYIGEAAKQCANAVIQDFNDIVVTREPSAGIRVNPSRPSD